MGKIIIIESLFIIYNSCLVVIGRCLASLYVTFSLTDWLTRSLIDLLTLT